MTWTLDTQTSLTHVCVDRRDFGTETRRQTGPRDDVTPMRGRGHTGGRLRWGGSALDEATPEPEPHRVFVIEEDRNLARPKKQFADPKKRKQHEAALARRRAAHAEARTIQMASQAAEGQVDFVELVEAEKQRLAERTQQQKIAAKGGSQSPKVTVKARDDLAMAFDLMGGVPALVVWGRTNPTEFYRIWARLIPREAADTSTAMPLEELLTKLASKEELTVAQAAYEIGSELLEEGRRGVEAEDAFLMDTKGSA